MTRPAIPIENPPFINNGVPFRYADATVTNGVITPQRMTLAISPEDDDGTPGVRLGVAGCATGFYGHTPRTRPNSATVPVPVAVADLTDTAVAAAGAAPAAYNQTQMGEVVALVNDLRSKYNDGIVDMANATKTAVNLNRLTTEELRDGLGDTSSGVGLFNV